MVEYDINDTIAAIATSPGEAGIGIVRISGKEALAIADRFFVSRGKKKPSAFKTYTTHYGWVVNPSSVVRRPSSVPTEYGIRNTEYGIIDEVILTVMRAPKSYTKEDTVEINCHGGIVALRAVLGLVLENGCRIAHPGEFTKRAFLNGRIDLAQAEAVLDIIRAKTDSALKVGIEQLKGNLSSEINNLRDSLLDILSQIEANIDFPDEETGAVDLGNIAQKLRAVNKKLKAILENSRQGRVLREGINAVICGRPNVGKSSLLNALLKQERAIVTPIAGTTRDTIEEVIDIKGIPVKIVDTAGIIEPRGLIERKAIRRSNKYIASADLVILLFDGSKRITREDRTLMKKLEKKPTIAVINKMDLKQRIERGRILKIFHDAINISARKCKNIGLLESAIANLVYNGKVAYPESVLVSNLRHIEALKRAEKLVAEAADSSDNKLSLEFIAQDIKDALKYLDNISGRVFSQDLLDRIFSDFCIGK